MTALAILVVITMVFGLSCGTRSTVSRNGTEGDTRINGLGAARGSARYLRDLERMILDHDVDPSDFDKKWRWAWQEADKAKQAGFDQEVTDNLYCSLAGFAAHFASGTGLSEGAECLQKADGFMRDRYGK